MDGQIANNAPVSPIAPPAPSNKPKETAFLPIVNQKKSGLQVYVTGEKDSTNSYYSVSIDKLSPDQYNLESYYIQDGKLNLFVAVNQSFIDGIVTVFKYTTARLLQAQPTSVTPSLIGSINVKRFDIVT